MIKRFLNWVRSEEGQAMSEYGLVLAIAAVGIIGVLVGFRNQLRELFTAVTNSLRGEADTTQ